MNKEVSIFNKRLLNSRLSNFTLESIPDLDDKRRIIEKWKYIIENINLNATKQRSIQEDFLSDLFSNVLGYKKHNGDFVWNITHEQKMSLDRTTCGGTLGFFTTETNDIRITFELKDAKTDLDRKQIGSEHEIAPIEQAFFYAPTIDKKCRWAIVSNFIELRLYHSFTHFQYEKFIIPNLIYDDEFKKFYYLMCVDNLICRDDKSSIDRLYEENEKKQESITNLFYINYKTARLKLFEGLKRFNSEVGELLLFEKTQKLMDRFTFIFFCQSKGLLPEKIFHNVVIAANLSKDSSNYKVWNQLKGLFSSINKGNGYCNINRFNGGLFEKDSILDNLLIPDELFDIFDKLANYDFETDLNVNILGHIFEQNVSDIEEIKAEINGQSIDKRHSKRKKEGIFYTPEYITHYIVEQTIGRWLEERKRELGFYNLQEIPELKDSMTDSEKRIRRNIIKCHIDFWEIYRTTLLNVKVLDIACGSGAFLNQAFDYLFMEGQRVSIYLSELHRGKDQCIDLNKYILKNNIYGVDINRESVEITKLSLWLKTANKNDILTSLDENIKCGNSLVDDDSLSVHKAFKWEEEFKQIIDEGGFDLVIGNPPYVRQEYLSDYKDYFKIKYSVFDNAADLFAYFYERGITLLKPGGIIGFISNSFAKTTASTELRSYLQRETKILSYTDLSNMQIFEDATTYPIIFVAKKAPNSNNQFKYLKVNKYNISRLIGTMNNLNFYVRQGSLDKANWTFGTKSSEEIMRKLQTYSNVREIFGKCYRGVLTGLNEAFIISDNKRNEIINDCPNCIEFIKPLLEGKDLSKWTINNSKKWLVFFPKGWTKQRLGCCVDEVDAWAYLESNFSSLANHLKPNRDAAHKRYDKGDFWWELRACDYYSLFEKPKIVWSNLQCKNKFALEGQGFYINAPAVIIPTDSKVLLGVLNSKLVWYFLKHICVVRNGGFIEVKPQYFEQIPIVLPEDSQEFNLIVNKVISLTRTLNMRIKKFNSFIEKVYKPRTISEKVQDFYSFRFEDYLLELKKHKAIFDEKSRIEFAQLFEKEKSEVEILLKKINILTNDINQMVYKLYGINDDEISIIENEG